MKVARIRGIPLHVNEWLILLFLFYFLAGVGTQALSAFLFVALHELGHLLAAKRLGFGIEEVEFFPFGGVARLSPGLEQDPRTEITVALFGPFCNFLAICVLWMLENQGWFPVPMGWEEEAFYRYLMGINLFLGLFNLLPMLPLDGGRILRAFWTSRLGVYQASRKAAGFGEIGAILLGIFGILGLYFEITGLDIPLLAGFLFLGAQKEKGASAVVYMRFLTGKRQKLLKGNLFAAEPLVARAATPLSEIVPRLSLATCLIISVVDDEGRVLGQVSEGQILEALWQEAGNPTIADLLPKSH